MFFRPALLGILASSIVAFHGQAQQSGETARPKECFLRSQFENWRSPDPRTLIIRVRPNRYFRLDLDGQCPKLQWPGARLVSVSRGKETICSPLDWDISVSGLGDSAPEQCVVSSMTPLTPEEVAAIPAQFRP